MATKYWIGTGLNWNNNAGWSTTSGGANDTTAGVAGDAVIFDNNSGACTVSANAGGAGLLSLNFWNGGAGSRYTNTITMNFAIFVAGAIDLSDVMTSTGTGKLAPQTTATLTAHGATWGAAMQLGGTSQTYTLADAWSVTGGFTVNGGGTEVLNGNSITIAGGLTITAGSLTGTTAITLTGGTWSNAASPSCANSVTLDGAVTLSGTINWTPAAAGSATLTYTSGTITTSGSILKIAGAAGMTTTLDCNGMTFNTVEIAGTANTVTLASALAATTLQWDASADPSFIGAAGFTVGTLTTQTAVSAKVMTLLQTNTYTVTTSLTVQGASLVNSRTIASSSGTLLVPFNLQVGAGQDVRFCKATRVDSSGGQKIYSSGVAASDLSTSINWEVGGNAYMWLF